MGGAGEFVIEGGQRDRGFDQPQFRKLGQDVEIARNGGGFGDQTDGMLETQADFKDGARQPQLPLDRLVSVGVGADHNGFNLVAGLAKLLF